MSNQPPYPGSGDPQGSPYGQPNPYGDPQNPYGNQQPNPYGNQPGYGYPQPGQQPGAQPGQHGQQGQPGQQPWQGGSDAGSQSGYADQQWQQQQYGGQYGQPGQANQYGQPSQGSGGSGGKKKWLIPVLALVGLLVVGGIVFGVLALGGSDSDSAGTEINSIKGGDCLTSSDIKDAKESVGGIKVVGCDKAHDAEAFATFSAGDNFDLGNAGDTCVEKLTDVSLTFADLEADGNQVRPLVASDSPSTDDQVVCIIRNADGEQLTSALAEGGSNPSEESTS